MVLLVGLTDCVALNIASHLSNDLLEVCGAGERKLIDCLSVSLNHSFHASDLRIIAILVEREAVRRGTLIISTEAVQVYLLVRVIVLENLTDTASGEDVLIAGGVKVV